MEEAATQDVPGTTADPGMLPAMPGLSRHREQPEAPGTAPLRAPAPRLASLWERDLKHHPCAETQEREGSPDPTCGARGSWGSRP